MTADTLIHTKYGRVQHMNVIKSIFLPTLLLSASQISIAQDMSGWSDKTVCRLAKTQADNSAYLAEAESRNLSCSGDTKSIANNTKTPSSWNNPNELDQLKIPENWEPFKNYTLYEFERSRADHHIERVGFRGRFGNDLVNTCPSVLKHWQDALIYEFSVIHEIDMSKSMLPAEITDKHRKVTQAKCLSQLVMNTFRESDTPEFIEDVLLHWVNEDELQIPKYRNHEEYSYYHYQYVSTVAFIATHYATYLEDYDLTSEQHTEVQKYLANKLKTVNPTKVKNTKSCVPENIKQTIAILKMDNGGRDTCGSTVWKMLVAELTFGLRFNDEEIFENGIAHTKWQLHFFDNNGTFITWAMSGPNTFHYSKDVPAFLGTLTEIFHSLGYDFMKHKIPNGLTIKEVMDRQIDIFESPQLLWEYAKLTPQYRGVDSDVYKTMSDDSIRDESNVSYESIVRNMARYVDEYRPDMFQYRQYQFSYKPRMLARFVMSNSVNGFNVVDSYSMYKSSTTRKEICDKIGYSQCQ